MHVRDGLDAGFLPMVDVPERQGAAFCGKMLRGLWNDQTKPQMRSVWVEKRT